MTTESFLWATFLLSLFIVLISLVGFFVTSSVFLIFVVVFAACAFLTGREIWYLR